MSNGGPHGDKWNKFALDGLNSDEVLNILNLTPDGAYASSAVQVNCDDGPFLFVGYYGGQGQQ